MSVNEVLEQYHAAADAFSRGDPEPVKMMFSRRDDVTLANPFGPAVRGWKKVAAALDFASSRFRDGRLTGVDTLAQYEASDVATIFEIEHWSAKVGARENAAAFDLRVTTTLRREEGDWKVVHRHADPISTADADGPLRSASR